jgi:hypothetical protein
MQPTLPQPTRHRDRAKVQSSPCRIPDDTMFITTKATDDILSPTPTHHHPGFRTQLPLLGPIRSNPSRVAPLSPMSTLTAVIGLSCPPHLVDVAASQGRPRTHSRIQEASAVPRTQVLKSLPSFKKQRSRMGRRQLRPRSCRAPTARHMFQIPKSMRLSRHKTLTRKPEPNAVWDRPGDSCKG